MQSTTKAQPCINMCGVCDSCVAYVARRTARIAIAKARQEAPRASRTFETPSKASREPETPQKLPRRLSGLLSGISGKLSTAPKRRVVLSRDAAGRLCVSMPAPAPTPEPKPTGLHICAPTYPPTVTHASVHAEISTARAAARADTAFDPRVGAYVAHERALR